MKKIKYTLAFIFLSLVAFSGILFGCANKYANMKIEVSETDLVFYYGGTDEQEVEMTKSFTANVLGAPNDVSKNLTYSLTNDIVTINMSNKNGETTFELFAKQGAGTSADLVIKSVESDSVKAVVHISIVCRVSSIAPNPDFANDAFVEVGQDVVTKQISQNAVTFLPAETNQKSLTYALKQNIQGIQIDNGNIVIDPQTLPKNVLDLDIIATSADNSQLSATITYHIIKKFDIKLQQDSQDLEQELVLTTNEQYSDKNPVVLDVLAQYLNGSDVILDAYTVKSKLYQDQNLEIEDNRELVVSETDHDQILLNARKTELDNPYVFLKVWAEVDDYNYQTQPVVVKIKVETVATEVSVTYQNESKTQTINYQYENGKLTRLAGGEQVDVTLEATYQIYDNYVGTYGSKFVISIGRTNDLVANKNFVLYSPDATKFEIFDKDGNKLNEAYILSSLTDIENIEQYALENDTELYIKALDTTSQSVLQIVTVDSIKNLTKNVAYTMIFDATVGVSKIDYSNSLENAKIIDNIAYIPVINLDDKTTILFDVLGNTSILELSASSDILSFESKKIVQKDEKFAVVVCQNPKYQNVFGDVVITLTADNNYSQKFTFRIFAKVNAVKIDVLQSSATNVVYDQNGSISSFALAKGLSASLKFVAYYGSKVQESKLSASYSGYDENAISIISNKIDVKNVGTYNIKVSVNFVDDESANGIGNLDFDIEVSGYLAVKTKKLTAFGESTSRESFALYSADSLGQDYIGVVGQEYSQDDTKYNYKKMNLSITFSDGTQFAGQDDTLQISWAISSSSTALVAEKVENATYETYCIMSGSTQLFVASRTGDTTFEVSALKGLETTYDAFLTVTISQLGKKETVQSRFVVKKAVQIEKIGNLTLQDNTTGRTQYITKDAIGNFVSGSESAEQVYYVYKPFADVLGGDAQYQIFAQISPTNSLVKNLDFEITKINYDNSIDAIQETKVENNEVVLTKNAQDCKIRVDKAGTYKLSISAKDSKTEDSYKNSIEVYFKFADGSQDAEIEIRTANEFADMLKIVQTNTEIKYYNIKNDINLSSIDSNLFAKVNLLANINGQNIDEETRKPFNVTLSGIYISKQYSKDSAITSNALVGLFASILQNSTVENLDLVINQLDVTFENVTNGYVGALAGQNFGTIKNVSVNHIGSKIIDNAVSSFVGGLVGQNSGDIYDGYTSGALSVENSTEILNNTNRFVGGIVGENISTIKMENTFFNNPNPQSNYSSTMDISIFDNTNATSTNKIALGGVAGKNIGTLSNVSFAGKLNGQNNVGGIVGYNEYIVTDAFAEAHIEGQENIGGIAGYSIGDISTSSTIFYSRQNYVLGANNVGGIVGNLENANISYCYIKSFYNSQSGDIRLKNSTNICYVGGLVGTATDAHISKSYSRAKLYTQNASHYVGGLVGNASNVQITNAFERNEYNVDARSTVGLDYAKQTNSTLQNFYCAYQNAGYGINGAQTNAILPTQIDYLDKSTYNGLSTNDWYFMMVKDSQTILADYPFLKQENGNLLSLEKPTQISVSKTNNNVSKVDNQTFVIWKNSQKIDFANNFDVVFSQSVANLSEIDIQKLNIAQDYYLTSNNESVAVVGQTDSAYQLELKNEGIAELTITSKANAELSKTITVIVRNKIDIQNIELNAENNILYANKIYQIKVSAKNSNDYYLEAKIDKNSNDIKINNSVLGESGISITANSINSIIALDKFDDAKLTFMPYILYSGQKVYCEIDASLTISSIYGISSFSLDTTSAKISPNSQLDIIAVATGENFGNEYVFEAVVIDENGQSISSDVDKNPLVINFVKDESSTQKEIIYNISISINYDNALNYSYFDKELIVEFTFSLDSSKSIYQTQTIKILLQKLYLQNIKPDFYKHIQKFENDIYGETSQVSSNSIIAGNLGVMQINLTPANADIDSIVIYHQQSDAYSMGFTQLVKNGDKFVDIGAYVKSAKNGFGIQLFKLSNYDNGNSDYTAFDGNIYAGLIISKAVPQNTAFNIVIEVTYNGGQTMTKTLTLYSEKASQVQILYDFNGKEYNDGNIVFVPLDIEKTITVLATDLFTSANSREEIAKSFSIQIGGVLTNFKVDSTEVSVSGESVLVNLPITISKFDSGYKIYHLDQEFVYNNASELNFVVVCTRTTSGSNREVATKNFTMYPMPFVVNGVNIKVANEDQTSTNIDKSLSIKKSTDTNVYAVLDCEYAEINASQAKTSISALENLINSEKNDNNAPKYWTLIDKYSQQIYLTYNVNNNRIVLNGSQVYNDYQFGTRFALSKNDDNSSYKLSNTYNTIDAIYNDVQVVSNLFDLSIYRDVADQDAIPVATASQLASMQKDNTYRLVPMTLSSGAVIEIENHIPFDLPENVTFDGNGMTIVIKSFYAGYTGTTYGLFASIGSGSVVKNFNVKYQFENNNFDTTRIDLSSLVFGGIVAQNNGILYNCSVEGDLTITLDAEISANIGGMIGSNAGFVSYCTSKIALSANNGLVAGFTSTNSKKISASKVLVPDGKSIENSNNQVSQKSVLAGFVARNTGEIDGCYVAGESENAKLKSNEVLAGFVYENQGTVKNAYVNILIDSGRAGGFVYSNSGEISSAYTKLTLTPAEQNSNQIAPFVGVDQLSGAINNSGEIDDCYYYSANFGSLFASNQIATMITDHTKSSFAKFIFATSADDGIWKDNSSSSSNPTLVEADREIINKYDTYNGYYIQLPAKDKNNNPIQYFDSANHQLEDDVEIYSLVQKIDSENNNYFKLKENQDINPTIYFKYVETSDTEIDATKVYYEIDGENNYVVVTEFEDSNIKNYYEKIEYFGSDNDDIFEKIEPVEDASKVWDNMSDFGTATNPRLIANASDWNIEFIAKNAQNDYFVLLCDIELSDTPFTAYNYTFAGKLLANNMSINKLYINESEIDFEKVAGINDVKSMGLLAEMDEALVKNLNISTSYNISANDIEKVGILTGFAQNSTIIDIDIKAQDTVVVGKNFVGGVAGIMQNAKVVGVNISASLNAVYAQSDSIALDSENSNFVELNEETKYSYAGLVAGVLTGNTNVTLANISGKNMLIGYNVGLVAGLVDQNAKLYFANAQIEPEQFIKGYVVAGGLVGENRGLISQSQIVYDTNSTRNLTFFAGNPFFAGGLVGFNNGGTIQNSLSTIDVRSAQQQIADSIYVVGGLVGLDVGGKIEYCYATGSVRGEYILGGFIGAVARQSFIKGVKKLYNSESYIAEGKLDISNCFASNQWLSYTNSADDSHYISDTRIKGTIFGAFVDSDFATNNSSECDKLNISEFISNFENVYFNTYDSDYLPNSSDNNILTGTFTAGKFMRAFGSFGGAHKLNSDEDTFNKNPESGAQEYVQFTEDNLINICSIGGTVINFNTTSSNIFTKEKYQQYNVDGYKLEDYFASAFVGGALICNANAGDFDIIYGENGVYAEWDKSIFNLPYDENSQTYHSSIYPSLIVNINK